MGATKNKDVFIAIADPTRRQILEILRDKGVVKAGDLASQFSTQARPSISRHLRLLRDVDLVYANQYGREWHYQLNAKPLAEMHSGWLSTFANIYTDSLSRLRDIVEKDN